MFSDVEMLSDRLSGKITRSLGVVWIVLATSLIVGCQSPSVGSGETDELDCDYDPVGIGSWGPGESLAEFSDSSVVIKGEVTGHSVRSDEQSFEPGGRPFTDRALFNEVRVLSVLRGTMLPGDQIIVSSGGGVCLENGSELYLYLKGDYDPDAVEAFVDDPLVAQPAPVYYIVHPYAQFPIKNGRVEIYDGFGPQDFVYQFQDMSEAQLEARLREALIE